MSIVDGIMDLVFEKVWETLAELAYCDALGGMQFRRVLSLWVAAGRPPEIGDFILKHTEDVAPGNRHPEPWRKN